MKKLTDELLRIEYDALASVLQETIQTCPVYAAQTLEPQMFVSSIVEMLHGLSFENLEELIDSPEGAVIAYQIAMQAGSIKKSLYAYGDFIMIANTPQAA